MVDIHVPAYNGLAYLKSLWNTCVLDAVWNKNNNNKKNTKVCFTAYANNKGTYQTARCAFLLAHLLIATYMVRYIQYIISLSE